MNKASLSDLRILRTTIPIVSRDIGFVSKTKTLGRQKFWCQGWSDHKTASESARNIVCWLKDIYRDDWVDFFRFRNEKPAYPIKIGKNGRWLFIGMA